MLKLFRNVFRLIDLNNIETSGFDPYQIQNVMKTFDTSDLGRFR